MGGMLSPPPTPVYDIWGVKAPSVQPPLPIITSDEMVCCTHSQVKMELPSSSSTDNSGTRLDGSFVMYNYARMATLLFQYQRHVERGEYSPPPPMEDVDFSLLSDMVRWSPECEGSSHLPTPPTPSFSSSTPPPSLPNRRNGTFCGAVSSLTPWWWRRLHSDPYTVTWMFMSLLRRYTCVCMMEQTVCCVFDITASPSHVNIMRLSTCLHVT